MTDDREITHIRAARRIGADPTSTALLLAGPAAMELWPGVRLVGEVGGRTLVEAELAAAPTPTAASVRARPPRRTPTSFVTRFAWTGPGLPITEGTLTLTYASGADGAPSTHAELVLDSSGLGGSRLDQSALTAMAEQFLANLAGAAESRSRAA
jgi:hypothetical protein